MWVKGYDTNGDGASDFWHVFVPPPTGGKTPPPSPDDVFGCVWVCFLVFLGWLGLLFLGPFLSSLMETKEPSPPPQTFVENAVVPKQPADQPAAVRRVELPLSPAPSERTRANVIREFFSIPAGDWQSRLSLIDDPKAIGPWVRAFEEEMIRRNPEAKGFRYQSVSIPERDDGTPDKFRLDSVWPVAVTYKSAGTQGALNVYTVRRANGIKISWWHTYLPHMQAMGWLDAAANARPKQSDTLDSKKIAVAINTTVDGISSILLTSFLGGEEAARAVVPALEKLMGDLAKHRESYRRLSAEGKLEVQGEVSSRSRYMYDVINLAGTDPRFSDIVMPIIKDKHTTPWLNE